MPARRGEQCARYFRPGDHVRALQPSPLAEIREGERYVVRAVQMDDPMGYVVLEGISEVYRPYLLELEASRRTASS